VCACWFPTPQAPQFNVPGSRDSSSYTKSKRRKKKNRGRWRCKEFFYLWGESKEEDELLRPPIRRAILEFNPTEVTEEDDDEKRDRERQTERERGRVSPTVPKTGCHDKNQSQTTSYSTTGVLPRVTILLNDHCGLAGGSSELFWSLGQLSYCSPSLKAGLERVPSPTYVNNPQLLSLKSPL